MWGATRSYFKAMSAEYKSTWGYSMDQDSGNQVALSQTNFQCLADCVAAVGTLNFARLISEFCGDFCRADAMYLTAFFHQSSPTVLHSSYSNASIQQTLVLYAEVAYILDPYYLHFKDNHVDEVVELSDFAPDDFKKSEYYR